MLVLTLKQDEWATIGRARVKWTRRGRNKNVELIIDAPRDVAVVRESAKRKSAKESCDDDGIDAAGPPAAETA